MKIEIQMLFRARVFVVWQCCHCYWSCENDIHAFSQASFPFDKNKAVFECKRGLMIRIVLLGWNNFWNDNLWSLTHLLCEHYLNPTKRFPF